MTNLDECVITVPIVGGILSVGRLATRLTALAGTQQIGPWHIGHWIDFKHTAIRIQFGPLPIVSARERPGPAQQGEFRAYQWFST